MGVFIPQKMIWKMLCIMQQIMMKIFRFSWVFEHKWQFMAIHCCGLVILNSTITCRAGLTASLAFFSAYTLNPQLSTLIPQPYMLSPFPSPQFLLIFVRTPTRASALWTAQRSRKFWSMSRSTERCAVRKAHQPRSARDRTEARRASAAQQITLKLLGKFCALRAEIVL